MPRLRDADHRSIYERLAGMDDNALLTPGEVAELMRVDPKTVTRWAAADRISSIKTIGGHRRYKAGTLKRLLLEVASETVIE